MADKQLDDLFLDTLKDIYFAERHILKALPKMAKAAQSPQLKSAFEEHLEQTKNQVNRLDQVFEAMGLKARTIKCQGMEGIIEEGEEISHKRAEPEVRDAALISAAQRAEHYEIACYGTLRTYAKRLGQKEAFDLLGESLEEEKETDKKLTELAEGGINEEAAEVGEMAEAEE